MILGTKIVFIFALFYTKINNSEFNISLYNYLKSNAEFEVVDINFNSTSNSRELDSYSNMDIDIIDIITLAAAIYNLFSGNIQISDILSLAKSTVKLGLFSSVPSTYDFIKKNKRLSMLHFEGQRPCQSAAGYAVAILLTYRRYLKEEEYTAHLPYSIYDHLGYCSKFNVLDALNFVHENGLMELPCDEFRYTPFSNTVRCKDIFDIFEGPYYYENISYYNEIGEPYKIEGKDDIKKEIYKRGPVITTYKLYDGMIYYKSGYINKGTGTYIGSHEAIIYGWDHDGWLAQSVFGDFWGDKGRFKVNFDNDIDFGYIAYANNKNIKNSYLMILYLIFLLF